MNPNANIEWSLSGGLVTGPDGVATNGGIEIIRYPTKEEPWTDVMVTIRTSGTVTVKGDA